MRKQPSSLGQDLDAGAAGRLDVGGGFTLGFLPADHLDVAAGRLDVVSGDVPWESTSGGSCNRYVLAVHMSSGDGPDPSRGRDLPVAPVAVPGCWSSVRTCPTSPSRHMAIEVGKEYGTCWYS